MHGPKLHACASGAGFNGQEKVNEIAGIGNHYTAKFWEYDARIARRWNLDPKPTTGVSEYTTFSNNPIFYKDVFGDSIRVYSAVNLSTSGGYVVGEGLSSKGELTLKALMKTKRGRDFFAQFAAAGDEIGGYKFEKSGKLSKYNINVIDVNMRELEGNFPSAAEGALSFRTNESGTKPEFSIQIMSFRSELPKLIETAGHELPAGVSIFPALAGAGLRCGFEGGASCA